MRKKEEILEKHCNLAKIKREQFVGIMNAMDEYAKEYFAHNGLKTQASDCTCCGDSTGFATNPDCILHGKNRK